MFSSALLLLQNKSQPSTVPDIPFELQEFETSRISRQSAHKGGKVVSLRTGLLYPTRNTLGTQVC